MRPLEPFLSGVQDVSPLSASGAPQALSLDGSPFSHIMQHRTTTRVYPSVCLNFNT